MVQDIYVSLMSAEVKLDLVVELGPEVGLHREINVASKNALVYELV